MLNLIKWFGLFVKSLLLVVVFTFGLVSIIATQGSSGDDPTDFFADAGRDLNVPDGEWFQLDGTGSHTPLSDLRAGEQVIYFWSVLSSPPKPDLFPFPETYQLENATTIRPRLVPIVAGEYVVQLHIRFGRVSAWDTVSVFAVDGPPPSNARAGADRFVKHGSLVQLDGSQSYSVFEDLGQFSDMPLQYSWFMNEQPANTSSSLSSTDSVNPRFIAEFNADDVDGNRPTHSLYETRLHVINDNNLASQPVHVKTYVYPAEGYVYPTPVVGPDQKVITGASVQLDGSNSYDVDGRSLDFDWQFYARPAGSSATLTGADTASPSFVADQDGIYVVQLQVSNEELSSIRLGPYSEYSYSLGRYFEWGALDYAGTDRVVITAYDGSAVSLTDAGPDQMLPFSGPVAIPLDGSGSYDINDDEILYRWYLMNAPQGSVATIDTPQDTEPDSASLLADMAGSYVIGLNTDPHHQGDYKNDHVIITLTENNAPAAAAGVDLIANVGESVQLDGSASSDPDSDPLGYSWSLLSAPGDWGFENVAGTATWHDWPALSDGMGVNPTFTPESNGVHRLLLTVNDGQQSSQVDEVVITAVGSPANTAPVAEAGANQTVTVGDTVLLVGSGSSDADLDELTYSWSIENRPIGSSAILDDATSETPSFVADVEGEYIAQLIVNDGMDDSNPDLVSVHAVAEAVNQAPVADAGSDQTITVGATVVLDGAGSSDADSDPITFLWSIESRPLASSAALDDPGSETPSFVADVEGSYTVQLIVNDGTENSIPDSMMVTAQSASACANPLNLLTSLPFSPGLGEMPTNIRIDGTDLSAVAGGGMILDTDVYQAIIPDGSNPDQAAFDVLVPATWEEISRTHANPIADSASPSFIVRNISDDIYYQIDVDFTGDDSLLEVQIDALSGCRCGNSAASCPL